MIHLPLGIPCADLLCSEGQAVETYEPSAFPLGKVEGLRVLFLNLMPVKQDAEIDTARVLSFADEDVWLLPIRIAGQTYKNTPLAHMERFYRVFDEVSSAEFDGLIINGAPLELLPFEQVRYWPQLCEIMDWAVSHVRASLFVCWGAFAALYHYYGIPKYIFEKKRLGIFSHKVVSLCPLTEGLPQAFPVPTSRYSEVSAEDFRIHEKDGLQIVAQCEESGVGIAFDAPHRRAFQCGPPRICRRYARPRIPPRHRQRTAHPNAGQLLRWRRPCPRLPVWVGVSRQTILPKLAASVPRIKKEREAKLPPFLFCQKTCTFAARIKPLRRVLQRQRPRREPRLLQLLRLLLPWRLLLRLRERRPSSRLPSRQSSRSLAFRRPSVP